MKNFLAIIFCFLISPVFALNVVVESLSDITSFKHNVSFSAKVLERAEFKSGFVLNKNDVVQGKIIRTVEAKRIKRSGYIVIKPNAIYREGVKVNYDRDLEAKVTAYSKTDWKKTGKTAGLSAGLTVGSHFVPGLSQIFYFSKGVLKPQDDQSRLESGVKSVYENSPFAYIEKGQDLNIEKGDYLVLKFYHSDVAKWQYFKRTK